MKLTGKLAGLLLVLLLNGLFTNAYAASDLKAYVKAMNALEADFDRKSADRFLKITDFDEILTRAFADIDSEVDKEFKKNFIRGFKNKGIQNLSNKILGLMPDQNGAKLIRVSEKKGKVFAAMRLDYQENGYGYLDFELEKDKKTGAVRIVDWYDYMAGQNYSLSLTQIVATISPDPNLIRKMFDIASGKSATAQQILKMIRAGNQRDLETTRTIYNQLDDSIKKQWVFMVISANMANLSGDMDFYKQVLGDVEKNFAGDPKAAFVLIDYYFLEEDYDHALKNIMQLSKLFNDRDAGLWQMNSNTSLMKGDFPGAIKAAQNGLKYEPDFELAYWSLLNAQIMSGDNKNATGTIQNLEKRFGYKLTREILAQEEMYKEYINSPEYISFERSR